MESTTRYGKHCKTNRKSLPWCALANSTSTATVKNSSSSPEKQNRKCSSTTPSANSYHPAPKARNNHKQTASGDGELWTCKQGKAEHSLEAASRKAKMDGCGKICAMFPLALFPPIVTFAKHMQYGAVWHGLAEFEICNLSIATYVCK